MTVMLVCQVGLAVCLVLLVSVIAAQGIALRSGRNAQAAVLRFFRLGLGLSACSYALRLLGAPPNSAGAILSFLLCVAGTALIWRGWSEQGKLQQARASQTVTPPKHREEAAGSLSLAALSVPARPAHPSVLTVPTQRVLCEAQVEAHRRRQCCVDTEHLLLGLLREPHCAGADLLARLGIPAETLRDNLLQKSLAGERPPESPAEEEAADPGPKPPALTCRARQVLLMAAQEAYRFEKAAIGTEHLLLGLLLIGTGPAASALFQAGVTVDCLRHEILTRRESLTRR